MIHSISSSPLLLLFYCTLVSIACTFSAAIQRDEVFGARVVLRVLQELQEEVLHPLAQLLHALLRPASIQQVGFPVGQVLNVAGKRRVELTHRPLHKLEKPQIT